MSVHEIRFESTVPRCQWETRTLSQKCWFRNTSIALFGFHPDPTVDGNVYVRSIIRRATANIQNVAIPLNE